MNISKIQIQDWIDEWIIKHEIDKKKISLSEFLVEKIDNWFK